MPVRKAGAKWMHFVSITHSHERVLSQSRGPKLQPFCLLRMRTTCPVVRSRKSAVWNDWSLGLDDGSFLAHSYHRLPILGLKVIRGTSAPVHDGLDPAATALLAEPVHMLQVVVNHCHAERGIMKQHVEKRLKTVTREVKMAQLFRPPFSSGSSFFLFAYKAFFGVCWHILKGIRIRIRIRRHELAPDYAWGVYFVSTFIF